MTMSCKDDDPSRGNMEELPAPWTDFYVDTSRERFDRDAAWTYLSTIAYWVSAVP